MFSDREFATLGLALVATFSFTALYCRSALQRKRTGDSGFRTKGLWKQKTDQVAAATILLGSVILVLATLAVFLGATDAIRGQFHPLGAWVGLPIAVVGMLLTIVAQLQMGDSWRIGIDDSEQTQLVVHGLYRWCRNPIYTGVILFGAGVVLLAPTVVGLASGVATWFGFEIQVRLVEEPFLIERHGTEFIDYASRVGRFVPLVGRYSAEESGSATRETVDRRP